ncbi:uncharacterized protein LOC110050910 [Orbicella faveolata]|uniref:uncharacterized protein LOC110050910 n=1 Tax=Orbicella faveolata TaxID=48498 RepID=UPI0009E36149|nr:uncharacterized protein LOC110050910 [Orbicella faveolata]
MATAEGFLQSPLVVWANNTFKGSALIESITDLADGVFLNEIMMDIDPTYFTLTRIHQNVYGDVNLRMQNLDTLVKHLKRYYQVRAECSEEMKIKLSVLLEKRKRASKMISFSVDVCWSGELNYSGKIFQDPSHGLAPVSAHNIDALKVIIKNAL